MAEDPAAITLPSWLVDALPILSGSELKVILAAMFDTAAAGHRLDAPMPSASRLAQLTGLSRQSVITARQTATAKALITKAGRRRSTVYTLSLDGYRGRSSDGTKTRPVVCNVWSPSLDSEQQDTMVKILDLGVAPPVALDIVRRYEQPYILRHLQHALDAHDAGIAWNPAGWLIVSLRDNRAPPLLRDTTQPKRPTWYTAEEYEKYIKH